MNPSHDPILLLFLIAPFAFLFGLLLAKDPRKLFLFPIELYHRFWESYPLRIVAAFLGFPPVYAFAFYYTSPHQSLPVGQWLLGMVLLFLGAALLFAGTCGHEPKLTLKNLSPLLCVLLQLAATTLYFGRAGFQAALLFLLFIAVGIGLAYFYFDEMETTRMLRS